MTLLHQCIDGLAGIDLLSGRGLVHRVITLLHALLHNRLRGLFLIDGFDGLAGVDRFAKLLVIDRVGRS